MIRKLGKQFIILCFSIVFVLQCNINIYSEQIPVDTGVVVSGTGEYVDTENVMYHLHFEKGSNDQECFPLPESVQFEEINNDTYSIQNGLLTIYFNGLPSMDIELVGTSSIDNPYWYINENCSISIVKEEIPEEETPIFEEDIYVNPNYPDTVISQPFLLQSTPNEEAIEYTSVEEAGLYLRQQMKARNPSVTFHFQTTSTDYKGLLRSIYEYAYMHTGVPTEGDYLFFQYGGYYCKITGYVSKGISHVIYTNTITYYADASKEQIVDTDIPSVLASLQLDGCSDYEKIKKIHDYVSTTVAYSTDSSNNDRFTAYGALENKAAVCQGYSVLFYRLCLEAGIDTRMISGTGNGIPHSWNIVLLDGLYYNVDTTWDHNSKDLYFLKSDADCYGHTRDEEYASDVFYAQYPMAQTSYNLDEMYKIVLPESIEMQPEDSQMIDVSFYPAKPDRDITLTWSVDDESICSVKDGKITALKPGETMIHVRADNGSEASCAIHVADYEPLVVSQVEDFTYDGRDHKWVPIITDVSGTELKENEDYTVEYNTDDFVNAGKIEVIIHGLKHYQRELKVTYSIVPCQIIVHTQSASKQYDGKPLMCPKGNIEGLVHNETLTFIVNGKITDVGSIPNSYLIKWDGTAKEKNYVIKEELGVLTIKKSSKTPSTGISTFRNTWISLTILSLIGIVFIQKRR